MTTIAYHKDSNTIAFDSRATSGSFICDINYNKQFCINGNPAFITGSDAHIESFIRIHSGLDNSGVHSVEEPDCIAFVVHGVEVYEYYVRDGLPLKCLIHENYAIGSGKCHAITAMDLGCDSKRSVEMAAMRDANTGGEIKVYKIEGDKQ